ncbi:2031_t:CDS:2 [Funneliformis geosporum]|nr:2031_t:CDS:2 [Funneliformis geosporum]
MDFQNRPGSKVGSGGVAGYSETNVDRRERLRKLALETIDLNKDPYFMKNHLGSYECKLPGYKVTKVRDPITRQLGLFFQIQYPEIGLDVIPRHRFMSAYEQRIEPPNKAHQYLLFAAEPYETISFKVQSKEVDKGEGKFFTHWDPDSKQFSLQFFFKNDRPGMYSEGIPPGMERTPIANPLNPYNAPAMRGPTFVHN